MYQYSSIDLNDSYTVEGRLKKFGEELAANRYQRPFL